MSTFTFFPGKSGENAKRPYGLFIIATLLLWGLGIFTLLVCTPDTAERIFSNKYYFVTRQLIFSAVGFAGLLFFALFPMERIRRLLPIFVIGTLVLCLIPLTPLGTEINGARRWVSIPHVTTFQPSEFAKLAVVLFLANLFSKYFGDDGSIEQKNFIYPLVGLFLFVIIIFLQRDFSTGVFVFAVGCILFFVSGARMNWFIPLLLLALPAAALLIFKEEYRIERVVAFLRPEESTLDSGYQLAAAQRAITAGGLWGKGLGTGMNTGHIPEIQSDFIFAGWANAMGLLGVTAYFAALIFFAVQGYRISLSCSDRFSSYGAFGCTSIIVLQSLLNTAVVCGVLPTTGIPQPFFSYGGTSLVIDLCMCGFILNAANRYTNEEGMRGEENRTDTIVEQFNGVVVENE